MQTALDCCGREEEVECIATSNLGLWGINLRLDISSLAFFKRCS